MAPAPSVVPGIIPLTLPPDHRAMLERYLPSLLPMSTHNIESDPESDAERIIPGNSLPNSLVPITLTYAMSLDAQISLSPGVQTVLSGPETKAMTHYLRSRHNGILVGVGTAEADDPSLNCRFAEDGVNVVRMDRQPRPLVLDPSARWSCRKDCKLLQLAQRGQGKPPIWIVNDGNKQKISQQKIDEIHAVGGTIITIPKTENKFNWEYLLVSLRQFNIHSLMVEGGGKVIQDLLRPINRTFLSCAIVTIAPVWLGDGGVSVCPFRSMESKDKEVARLKNVSWLQMGEDVVMSGFFQ